MRFQTDIGYAGMQIQRNLMGYVSKKKAREIIVICRIN